MRRTIAAALAVWVALGAAALPFPAEAHPLAPVLLEIVEQGDGTAGVLWRTSALRPVGSDVRPRLPDSCEALEPPSYRQEGSRLDARWTVDCTGSLTGRAVAIDGLGTARIDALARVELADGRVAQRVLRAGSAEFVIPERERAIDVLRSYGALGIEHILTGLDHLLFVFGLLLLVGRRTMALVKTVTAFTVGHSVTLSLAALDLLSVPQAPVELLIACSVFWLAVELARPVRGPAARRPWAMAALFGLLHGLGFAGALAEVGLPQADIPLALFSFNVGIEIGQLAFVAVIVTARHTLSRPLARLPRWSEAIPVYTLGTLAAYWCFQRAAALV
ncbi:MAG: HupE/UreJ family protein [Myxococcota bacterium]|nr:HupE/UreJ family protein [Myxococcota bacterium]